MMRTSPLILRMRKLTKRGAVWFSLTKTGSGKLPLNRRTFYHYARARDSCDNVLFVPNRTDSGPQTSGPL